MQSLSFGGSAGGSAYIQAINEGYGHHEAFGYGAITGASEVFLERILGGIEGFGASGAARFAETGVGKTITKRFGMLLARDGMKPATRAVFSTVGHAFGNMASEAVEESMQELLDPIFRYLILADEDAKITAQTFNDALYAGLLGALTAGAMNLPSDISNGTTLDKVVRGRATDADFAAIVSDKSLREAFEGVSGLTLSENPVEALTSVAMYSTWAGAEARLQFGDNVVHGDSIVAGGTPKQSENVGTRGTPSMHETARAEIADAAEKAKLSIDETLAQMKQNAKARNENGTLIESRAELATLIKGNIGKQINVDGEMRVIKGGSKNAIQTVRADGTVVTDALVGGDIQYTAHGFVYTAKDGSRRVYRFAEDVKGVQAKRTERILDETSSVDPEKPVEDYPYNMQTVLKDYADSIDSRVLDFVKDARQDNYKNFKRLNLDIISDKTAKEIGNLVGFDVNGYRLAINTDTVKHVNNRHGADGIHDHSMKNIEDVARIPYITENYDSIELLSGKNSFSKWVRNKDDSPAKMIRIAKKINGTFYVVEAVPDNNYKKIWVASAYIQKDDITQVSDAVKTTPDSQSSETPLASLSSNDSISAKDEQNAHQSVNNSPASAAPKVDSGGKTVYNEVNKDKGNAVNGKEHTKNDARRNDEEAETGLLRGISGISGDSDAGAVRGVRESTPDSGGNRSLHRHAQRPATEGVQQEHNAGAARSVFGTHQNSVQRASAYLKQQQIEGPFIHEEFNETEEIGANEFIADCNASGYELIEVEGKFQIGSGGETNNFLVAYHPISSEAIPENFKAWLQSVEGTGVEIYLTDEPPRTFADGVMTKHIAFYTPANGSIFINVNAGMAATEAGDHEFFHYAYHRYPEIAERFCEKLFAQMKGEYDPQISSVLKDQFSGYIEGDPYSDRNISLLANELSAYLVGSLEAEGRFNEILRSGISDIEAVKTAWREMVDEVRRENGGREARLQNGGVPPLENGDGSAHRGFAVANGTPKQSGNSAQNHEQARVGAVVANATGGTPLSKASPNGRAFDKTQPEGLRGAAAKPLSKNAVGHDTFRLLKGISEALNFKIMLFEDSGASNRVIDGFYDAVSRTVYLNTANNGKPLSAALRHEIIHHLANVSPAAYKTFHDFVIRRYCMQYGENAYRTWLAAKKDEYAAWGIPLDETSAEEEFCANIGMDMLRDREVVVALTKTDKSVVRRLAEAIRRIFSRITRIFGAENKTDADKAVRMLGNLSDLSRGGNEARLTDDFSLPQALDLEGLREAERLLYAAMRGEAAQNVKGKSAIKYSISELRGENGDYGEGVILDTDLFSGISPRNWGKVLGKFVYENLAGKEFTVYDADGNAESIYLAKKNDRVTKDGHTNNHRVIDKLARYKSDNIRALATVQISEVLETSQHETSTDEHSHQWMDVNGWEIRKTYLQDRKGNIYEATLNIANGESQRVLYDINHVKAIDKNKTPGSPGVSVQSNRKNNALNGRAHDPEVSNGSISETKGNVNSKSKKSGIRYSVSEVKEIRAEDIKAVQSIGRKSVNDFTSEDIRKTEGFARRYFREMGVKSPFFRAWFGDWRAHDTSRKKLTHISDISAIDAIASINHISVENSDSHWNISIGTTGINDTVSHSGREKTSVKMLSEIQDIIRNAVLLDTEVSVKTSSKKHNDTAFMHKLYSLVEFNGKRYIAKVTVEEYGFTPHEGKRFYNLRGIKIESIGGDPNVNASYATMPDIDSAYSVSQLYDLVKTFDKNFHPKPVAPMLLNEDGTPKVFYHGTGAHFNRFDAGEAGAHEGSFFFAENREDAAAYGEHVMPVYLTAERLADYDNQPSEFYKLRGKRAQVAYLKERGYDGWYADMDSDGWGEVSVFDSTQIKSATDNIGAFDRGNPDIRYSVSDSKAYLPGSTQQIVSGAGRESVNNSPATASPKLDSGGKTVYNENTNAIREKAEIGKEHIENDARGNDEEAETGLLRGISGISGDSDAGVVRGVRESTPDSGGDSTLHTDAQRPATAGVQQEHNAGAARSVFGVHQNSVQRASAYLKQQQIEGPFIHEEFNETEEIGANEFIADCNASGYELIEVEGKVIIGSDGETNNFLVAYHPISSEAIPESFKAWLESVEGTGVKIYLTDEPPRTFADGVMTKHIAFYTPANGSIFINVNAGMAATESGNHEFFHYVYDRYPEIAERFCEKLFAQMKGEYDPQISSVLKDQFAGYIEGDPYADRNISLLANELSAYLVGSLEADSMNDDFNAVLRSGISDKKAVKTAWREMVDEVRRENGSGSGSQTDGGNPPKEPNGNGGREARLQNGGVPSLANATGGTPPSKASPNGRAFDKTRPEGLRGAAAKPLSKNAVGDDTFRLLKGISEALNFKIMLFEDSGESNRVIDGFYDAVSRTVYLNTANSGKPLSAALRHEIIHHLANVSPTAYKTFHDFVIRRYCMQYGENAYRTWLAAKKEEYAAWGIPLDETSAEEEFCANLGMDMLRDREAVVALTKTDKSVVRRLAEAIRRIFSRITRIFGAENKTDADKAVRMLGNLSDLSRGGNEARLTDDFSLPQALDLEGLREAERLLYAAMRGEAAQNVKGKSAIKYSISELRGENGDYGEGVILDTDLFDGISPRNWGKVLGKFVYENLAGKEFTVYDADGNAESIYLAKKNDRVTKDGAANNHRVIDKLARYKGDNLRALGTVHISELLKTSTYEKNTDEHSHQWMDTDGWEFRKAYLQDKSGNIYEAGLNIAIGHRGKILYDINPIKAIDKKEISGSRNVTFQNSTKNTVLNGRALKLYPEISKNSISETKGNVNSKSKKSDIRYSVSEVKEIRAEDIKAVQSIGRKSVNDFTSEDIQKTEPFARRYFREMGVKSPFFRAWFGDWRERDTSKVQKISRKSAERGTVKNADTGWNIIVSRQIFKETQHHSGESVRNAVQYLPYINDITEKSVLLSSEISGKANSLSAMFHTLYGYTEVMGYPALLKLRVEELIDEKSGDSIRRDYILQAIEEEPISESKRFSKAHQSETGSSDISISELFDLVKRFDKNFHPKPVAPMLLNEDGTPKVFYHGTGARFNRFDTGETGAHEDSFFFAENREDAAAYGEHVVPVYLTAERLADYDNQPSEFYKLRGKRAQVAYLKERGYDGWYADMDSDGWGEVSVFDSTQIKSATDNIGTFDRGNPDIRYSVSDSKAYLPGSTQQIVSGAGRESVNNLSATVLPKVDSGEETVYNKNNGKEHTKNDARRNDEEAETGLLRGISGISGSSDAGAVRGVRESTSDSGGDSSLHTDTQQRTTVGVQQERNTGAEQGIFGAHRNSIQETQAHLKQYRIEAVNEQITENEKIEMTAKAFADFCREHGYEDIEYATPQDQHGIIAYHPIAEENIPKEFREWRDSMAGLGVDIYLTDEPPRTFIGGVMTKHIAFYTPANGSMFINVNADMPATQAGNHEFFHYAYDRYPEIAERFCEKLFAQMKGEYDPQMHRQGFSILL